MSKVTCGRPTHGGAKSGRKVMICRPGRLGTRSTVRSNSSSKVGSIQWTSSNTASTGSRAANPSSCVNSA